MSRPIEKDLRYHPRSWGKVVTVTILAALLVSASSCREDVLRKAPTKDGRYPAGLTAKQAQIVLAKVGDHTITLGEFAATLERMDRQDRLRYRTPERREQLLKTMITVELLAQEAKRRGLDKRPEIVESKRQILRNAILKEAHKKARSTIEFSEKEVRAYYQAHADDYRIPERRRVADLVVDDEKQAKKLLEKAKEATPEEWGKLVVKHSLVYKDKGYHGPMEFAGDLGLVGPPGDPKGDNPRVPEAVRKAVFQMSKVGTVADEPIRDDKGRWHIIRFISKTPSHMRSFAEAERTIRMKMSQQDVARVEKELYDELVKKFPVKVDQEALKKVKVPDAVHQPPPPPHDPEEDEEYERGGH